MQASTTTITATDTLELSTQVWLPEPDQAVVGVVQIAHGMAEHAARYAPLAGALTAAGYAVYAGDHRGHGRTSPDPDDHGYFADVNGWAQAVADVGSIARYARAAHPDVPRFLLGHSMGSMLARDHAIRGDATLAGLVLSGVNGDPGALGRAGAAVAAAEARLRGRRHRSALLDSLTFGSFNKPFAPNRTAFDWLSRDAAEVDAYVADPLCGQVFTAGFFVDLLGGIRRINSAENVARVRASLPILLLAGAADPVGDFGAGVSQVRDQYAKAGVLDVTMTLYAGARHEIFNETNRDEVYADVLAWLDAHR